MAAPQYVVVELRVDASNAQQGAAQYSAALDKAQQAADALTGSADKAQKAITNQGNAMVQAKAANDNLASGYKAANDNFQSFGKSLADHAIDFLNNINHLKLMALGAYAMSPAFRSFTNTEISAGLKLIGVNFGLVSAAMGEVSKLAAPALSFFARISIPIAAAVLAWQGLNYVINLGSDILKKYADAERGLFASDVNDNLAKLTKFQTDTISLQQVAYATDLAARLKEAKQTISDFFAVQFDLTEPALTLQSAWVAIVEAIAKGIDLLNNFASKAQQLGNSSLWDKLNFGWHLPGALTPSDVIQSPQAQDNSAALALAKQKLAAAMGSSTIFANRFSGDISGLANPPKADSTSTNSYDRALQSIKDQIDLLKLEADGAGKTSEAYQELKTAHTLNIAAMKAGITPTDEMRATWKALGDQIAAYTIQLNQAKVLQDETFKSATMFLSPSDLAAATAAHQIDPTNWMAHLNDAGPKLASLNSDMGQLRDTSVSFLQSFNSDIVRGTVNMQTLTNAVQGLEQKFLDIAENQAINALFKSMTGGTSGGGFNILNFLGFGGGAGGGASADPAGGFVAEHAKGGMVGYGTDKVWIHSAYFENAPHAANGLQLPGGGIPIVAHPGERVLNPQETRAYNAGGGKSAIIINNYGADVQAQQHDDGTTELTVRALARDEMASPRTNSITKTKYGQSPQLRQRR